MNLAEIEDRIAKCNKIMGENPNSQIFAALADAYRKKGQLDEAFRICQNGLRIHPNYVSAHMVMARINLDKGMYDWAEIEVNKAAVLEGSSFATDLLLSEIYIRKGEFSKATKILDKLQKIDSANAQVQKLLELCQRIPLESAEQIQPGSASPKPGRPAPSQAEKPAEEKPPAEEAKASKAPPKDDSLSIEDFIDKLSKIGGIDGILLVNNEGLVGASRWLDDTSSDEFGAVVREIESTIQSQLGKSRFGEYENLLIESENLIISMTPMKDSMLMIKGSNKLNLGTLKLKMHSLLEKLDKDFLK